ncbi:MAG: hypothetical protein QXP04_05100, partial [Candidatus Nanoarchaeia archaeon]|nr:hypothetical protein [Candidatus Jingweiarchaeum tengchongense]
MKKFLVIAFVTLILINISIAQEYKANEAFIQFNASGYILLSGNFQMLNLTVRFVPQNYHSIVHNGNLSSDKYNNTVFTKIYNHPKNRVDWWINSTIFLNKTFAKLNRSYPFPYTNYPKEIERYL